MDDIFNILNVIRRYLWIVILTPIITGVVVYFGTGLITPKYSAGAQIRILTATEGNITYPLFNTEYATFLMNTYAAMGTNPEFLARINRTLPIDADSFPDISVEALPLSEILEISVEHSDPELTAATANALVDIFIEDVNNRRDRPRPSDIMERDLDEIEAELELAQERYQTLIEERGSSVAIENARQDLALKQEFYYEVRSEYFIAHSNEQFQSDVVSVVHRASVPTEPVSPSLVLNLGIGAVIGLITGVLIASLLAIVDNRLHSTSEIVTITDLDILGNIPRLPWFRRSFTSHTEAGAAFRRLTLKLLAKVQSQTLVIASAEPREGRTVITENIALSLLQLNTVRLNKRVVVIDTDLRKKSNKKNRFANFYSGPTLNELLSGEERVVDMLKDLEKHNACFIPSGEPSLYTSELIYSPRMSELIRVLEIMFDYVLIDTVDYLTAADASILGRKLSNESVIVVARKGRTNKNTLTWMLNEFENQNVGLVGVVVNFGDPIYRNPVDDSQRRHTQRLAGSPTRDNDAPETYQATDNQPLDGNIKLGGYRFKKPNLDPNKEEV